MSYNLKTVERSPNGLHSNAKFDNVNLLNGKPSAVTEGFTENISDSAKPDINGYMNSSILSHTPNLFKQNGVPMSNIPYIFCAIPIEFLTDEFLDDPIMMRFIRWMFKRISSKPSSVPIKNKRKNLDLDAFEFLYGRKKCAEQAGITLKQAERKIGQLVGSNWCSKVGSKSGSTFTVYRLSTENFSQNGGQHSGQHNGQHLGHNQDSRVKSVDKKNHPSIPSPEEKARDGVIDDFSEKKGKKGAASKRAASNEGKIQIFKGKYRNDVEFEVWLTQEELDGCMKFHGNREKIISQIEQIAASPKREKEISDWSNAIKKWKFPNAGIDRSQQNEAYGRNLEREYDNPSNFWGLEHYHDKDKDQKGTLFYSKGGQNIRTVFIPYIDQDYEKKVLSEISKNKMKKKCEK